MSKTLSGVIAAVATPIDDNSAPDLKRATDLARHLLDNGCDGLNVLGSTGEATSFARDERMAVMDAYKNNGLPLDRLMVGTGAASVSDAVALTQHAAKLGFAGALVLPPFYYKGVTDDGLVELHWRAGESDRRQQAAALSLSLPATHRHSVARRVDRTLEKIISVPHRGIEGLVRRHGLRALGRGGRKRLRRVPVDRSLPDRGQQAAPLPAASRQPPI